MKEITTQELKELQSQGKKMLVDIKAVWCGPCKELIPRLEIIEKDYTDIEFYTIDVDQNKEGVTELGVRGVPTVFIFNGENIIDKSVGGKPNEHYREKLNLL